MVVVGVVVVVVVIVVVVEAVEVFAKPMARPRGTHQPQNLFPSCCISSRSSGSSRGSGSSSSNSSSRSSRSVCSANGATKRNPPTSKLMPRVVAVVVEEEATHLATYDNLTLLNQLSKV